MNNKPQKCDNQQSTKRSLAQTSGSDKPSQLVAKKNKPVDKTLPPPTSDHIDLTSSEDGVSSDYDTDNLSSFSPIVNRKVLTLNKAKTKNDNCNKSEVIDLTSDLKIQDLRNTNTLFFSYDPRGKLVKHEESHLFCRDCRCPIEYCSEDVFGKMCYSYVQHLIAKLGFEEFKTELDVQKHYKRTFTELVHSKMKWNNITFHNHNEFRYVPIPDCMKRASFRGIIDDYLLWKESDVEVVSWGPDSVVEEEDDDLPPLLERSSSDDYAANGNANVNTIAERTAVEQAADIGPAFIMLKKFVATQR